MKTRGCPSRVTLFFILIGLELILIILIAEMKIQNSIDGSVSECQPLCGPAFISVSIGFTLSSERHFLRDRTGMNTKDYPINDWNKSFTYSRL